MKESANIQMRIRPGGTEEPVSFLVKMPPNASVVGRPRFDSLAESDQKTLKVGIHSFHA